MNRFVIVVLLGISVYRPAPAQETEAASVDVLSWLAGHWEGTFEGHYFESHYTTPAGGMVLGVSKQIRDGRVALFELERFEAFEGKVRLTPYPFGRASTASFELVEYDPSAKKAVFENMKHDFPQRLTYARTSPDRLEITLVGVIKGKSAEAKAVLQLVSERPNN